MTATCFTCREQPAGFPASPYSAYCPGCQPGGAPRPERASHGCGLCGAAFGTLTSFDGHQDIAYDRAPVIICREPAAMGLVADRDGTWQTPEGLLGRERSRQRGLAWAQGRAQAASQPSPGVMG